MGSGALQKIPIFLHLPPSHTLFTQRTTKNENDKNVDKFKLQMNVKVIRYHFTQSSNPTCERSIVENFD